MPKLINHQGAVVAPEWIEFSGDAGAVDNDSNVILPLDVWREYRQRWLARKGAIGVALSPSDDPLLLAEDLERLSLITIAFPSFTDGRGYSSGRLVRERLGFQGELRAVGEVLIDQLYYMARCGFSTFALRDDQALDAAARALRTFSDNYQATFERAPLFARRSASINALTEQSWKTAALA